MPSKILVTVHPHTRGEPFFGLLSSSRINGSSPHPRGTRMEPMQYMICSRFIPTPAGNPAWPQGTLRSRPVHPHTRGEPSLGLNQSTRVSGSSPHPRGTLNNSLSEFLTTRFIPTPAGNPRSCSFSKRLNSVHPHTRGEPGYPSKGGKDEDGSSPHPRGTHVGGALKEISGRFIPTPAGNPSMLFFDISLLTVHPHTRGEPVLRLNARTGAYGSSPHPRGTLPRPTRQRIRRRFIPTPAGNPLMLA